MLTHQTIDEYIINTQLLYWLTFDGAKTKEQAEGELENLTFDEKRAMLAEVKKTGPEIAKERSF